jgi:hypothetical protein
VAEPVDVRRVLARPARVRSDQRLEHGHRDVGLADVEPLEEASREVADANPVGLGNWPQRPLPGRKPARVLHEPKRRMQRLEAAVLFADSARARHPTLVSEEVIPRRRARDGGRGNRRRCADGGHAADAGHVDAVPGDAVEPGLVDIAIYGGARRARAEHLLQDLLHLWQLRALLEPIELCSKVTQFAEEDPLIVGVLGPAIREDVFMAARVAREHGAAEPLRHLDDDDHLLDLMDQLVGKAARLVGVVGDIFGEEDRRRPSEIGVPTIIGEIPPALDELERDDGA